MANFSCRHDGDAGDVVFACPCIRAFALEHGPVDLFLGECTKNHPFGGRYFTRERIEWLMPLLAAQEYISSVQVWNGEQVDVDLNLFRRLPLDYSRGDIAGWYRWAFPVVYDLSQPWLTVRDVVQHGMIVVNRTSRYRSSIRYTSLAGTNPLFVGLPDEFEQFRQEVSDAQHVIVSSALEAAQLIAGSKCFVGGQSLPYAIAEAMKVTRLLEVSTSSPNVIIHGPGGSDAINQLGFDFHVQRLCWNL